MGFYGNITNTSRTQFQFDKIYSNRHEMESKKNTDGIYAGRYVLIEYDSDTHFDHMMRVWIKADGYHSQNNMDVTTLLKEGSVGVDEIVYTVRTDIDREDPRDYKDCKFYKCTGFTSSGIAQFAEIVNGAEASAYVVNYNIDINKYGNGRGYDSTVWQKTYANGIEKYVMIAELNTVVPTFDVSADAPTMNPIVPHFDTRSTDVYYKLHWQAPWGFRVATADTDCSDENTDWTITTYDPTTGVNNTSVQENINAAIYYNKAALDSQVDTERTSTEGINKHSTTVMVDEIKVEPTGVSGNQYNKHDGSSDVESKPDIQEITINLPTIGNMVSDAWDIIHGPRRNDDMRETDGDEYVASLKGRLLSIDAIERNQIPIKRIDNGQLVGTMINGDTRDTTTDGLMGELSGSYVSDDAWIETKVDADNTPNAIAIHHTYHSTPSSSSSINVNNDAVTTDSNYKVDNLATNNLSNEDKDNINLYVPYVDAAGHVVGHNIETITLPFGFKSIHVAEPRSEEVSENATGTPSATDLIADTTQDILTINSGNKWIRLDTDPVEDSLIIRHDVHNTTFTDGNTDWTRNNGTVTIPISTDVYDEAGHYTGRHTEYYQLPYSYGGFIDSTTGVSNATSSYDKFAFESDAWLQAAVEQGKVTYTHMYPEKTNDTTSESNVNNNGDTIILETLSRDDKGHITSVNQNKVTLPYGYKTFKGDSGESIADNTQDTMLIIGDDWISSVASNDKITLTHKMPTVTAVTPKPAETPSFGDTFTIEDWYFDAKGHMHSGGNVHTVQFPKPSLISGTGNVVVGLELTPTSGEFVEQKANLGDISLGSFVLNNDDNDIEAKDSLQQALGRLQNRIDNKTTAVVNMINALNVEDDSDIEQYVSAISQHEGKINVTYNNLPVYAATDILETTQFVYKNTEADTTIAQLFTIVANLSAQVTDLTTQVKELQAKVELEHPTDEEL